MDFQAMSRTALAIWNTTMPELYFTEADDPQEADVAFMYSDEFSQLNGQDHAIHPDEQELVSTIGHLPQGLDMAGFQQ